MTMKYAPPVIALLAALASTPAWTQQSYPTRPLRLIVPLAPGGPSDILARSLAQKLAEQIGVNVLVENRPGAGATIGTDAAAKAAPDGYTMLLIGLSTYTINASLYSKLPYDSHKDLIGVSVLAEAPYILATHPSLPAKDVRQLIALDKSRPKELNFASGGTGTGPHLAMELLKDMTGITMVHIPYKGAGPGMTDLMAGHVQVMMVNMIAGLPYARQGRLRAIGVSRAKRSGAAPEIPSIAESGVPGFDTAGHHLVMIRSGTPREIVARLNSELVKVLNQPDVSKRLAQEGADIIGNSPDAAQAMVVSDIEKWAQVIRRLGLKH